MITRVFDYIITGYRKIIWTILLTWFIFIGLQATAVAEKIDVDLLSRIESQLKSLQSQVAPHVVQILVRIPETRLFSKPIAYTRYYVNLGLGVVYNDGNNQRVITSESLLRYGNFFMVVDWQGRERKASIVRKDYISNIGVLRYSGPRLESLPMDNVGNLKPGDRVFTVTVNSRYMNMVPGYGYGEVYSVPQWKSKPEVCRFIETGIKVFPGYCGAPLVNSEGKWIGLIVGCGTKNYLGNDDKKMNAVIGNMNNQGCGNNSMNNPNSSSLIIPINTIKYVAQKIFSNDPLEYGALGATIEYFSNKSHPMDKAQPVIINKIREGSPADKANLQPGDKILQCNGKNVNSWFRLFSEIINCQPGEKIILIIARGDEHLNIPVTIGRWGNGDAGLIVKEKITDPVLDILTQPVRFRSGNTKRAKFGVQVREIRHGSPLNSGLISGDVIIAVQGQSIHSPEQFRRLLAWNNGKVTITYLRNGILSETHVRINKNLLGNKLFKSKRTSSSCCNATIFPHPYKDIPSRFGPFKYKNPVVKPASR